MYNFNKTRCEGLVVALKCQWHKEKVGISSCTFWQTEQFRKIGPVSSRIIIGPRPWRYGRTVPDRTESARYRSHMCSARGGYGFPNRLAGQEGVGVIVSVRFEKKDEGAADHTLLQKVCDRQLFCIAAVSPRRPAGSFLVLQSFFQGARPAEMWRPAGIVRQLEKSREKLHKVSNINSVKINQYSIFLFPTFWCKIVTLRLTICWALIKVKQLNILLFRRSGDHGKSDHCQCD